MSVICIHKYIGKQPKGFKSQGREQNKPETKAREDNKSVVSPVPGGAAGAQEPSSIVDEIKEMCKIICDKVERRGGQYCFISVAETEPWRRAA